MSNTPTNDDDEFGEGCPPITVDDIDPMPVSALSCICANCGGHESIEGICPNCGASLSRLGAA